MNLIVTRVSHLLSNSGHESEKHELMLGFAVSGHAGVGDMDGYGLIGYDDSTQRWVGITL
jgi:hypothetical protein